MRVRGTQERWARGRWAAALLTLAGTVGGVAQAQALNFSLSPTSFTLDTTRTLGGQTRLTNVSPEAAVFTVSVFGWVRSGTEDQLTPTRDVLVSPSRFVLQPGGSQVVRVSVQRRPGPDELTYRVLITQVLPEAGELPGEDVRAQVRGLVQLSLPVYVVPPTASPRVGYEVVRSADGKDLQLRLSNSGNRSYLIKGLRVVANGGPAGEAPGLPQSLLLFRGNTSVLPLGGFGAATGLRLSFLTPDGRTINEQIQVP